MRNLIIPAALVLVLTLLVSITSGLQCYKCSYFEGQTGGQQNKDCALSPPPPTLLTKCDNSTKQCESKFQRENNRTNVVRQCAAIIQNQDSRMEDKCEDHEFRNEENAFNSFNDITYKGKRCLCSSDACNSAYSGRRVDLWISAIGFILASGVRYL